MHPLRCLGNRGCDEPRGLQQVYLFEAKDLAKLRGGVYGMVITRVTCSASACVQSASSVLISNDERQVFWSSSVLVVGASSVLISNDELALIDIDYTFWVFGA